MTTYTFSLEDNKAIALQKKCEELGLTMQEAFENFAKNFVRSTQGFPLFRWAKDKIDSYKFIRAIDSMRKISIKNGNCNMTLDEINAEIDAARKERDAREQLSLKQA